jgi:hypothetical protein
MLEVSAESRQRIKVVISGSYLPSDGEKVFEMLERYAAASSPPLRYYFDLGELTEFGLGYADIVGQAKRAMKLRFPERVVFGVYTTSAVVRGFATVFSRLVDSSRLTLVVSDDRGMIERALG